MKLKHGFILFILFLLPMELVFGAPTIEEFYITAPSGLHLRAEPSQAAASLMIVPFGAKVAVLEQTKNRLSVGGRQGFWFKAVYNGQEGFLFSAFLSRSAPVKAGSPTGEWSEGACKGETGRGDPTENHWLLYTFSEDGSYHVGNVVNIKETGRYTVKNGRIVADGESFQAGIVTPLHMEFRSRQGMLCFDGPLGEVCLCREQ